MVINLVLLLQNATIKTWPKPTSLKKKIPVSLETETAAVVCSPTFEEVHANHHPVLEVSVNTTN